MEWLTIPKHLNPFHLTPMEVRIHPAHGGRICTFSTHTRTSFLYHSFNLVYETNFGHGPHSPHHTTLIPPFIPLPSGTMRKKIGRYLTYSHTIVKKIIPNRQLKIKSSIIIPPTLSSSVSLPASVFYPAKLTHKVMWIPHGPRLSLLACPSCRKTPTKHTGLR